MRAMGGGPQTSSSPGTAYVRVQQLTPCAAHMCDQMSEGNQHPVRGSDVDEMFAKKSKKVPPFTYYWTAPLILDYSYLVGKSTRSKIADTKVSGFWRF
jgi:hypothetical protein